MSSHERSSKIIVLRGPRYDTAHLCIPHEPGNNARTPPWRAIEPSRAPLFGRELQFRKWMRTPLAPLGHYADEDVRAGTQRTTDSRSCIRGSHLMGRVRFLRVEYRG